MHYELHSPNGNPVLGHSKPLRFKNAQTARTWASNQNREDYTLVRVEKRGKVQTVIYPDEIG